MIVLEILESFDADAIGIWEFEQNSLIIGNVESKLGLLRIQEPKLEKNHFSLMVKSKFLYLHNNHYLDKKYVYVNDKKTLRGEVLFPGDIITIGQTKIKIQKFDYKKIEMGKELKEKLKRMIRGNHPIMQLIETIEKEIAKR